MRGMISSGRARFVTAQNDVIWVPQRITRKYPILFMPEGTNVANMGVDKATMPDDHTFLGALCEGGAVVVVFDGDVGGGVVYGSSWGAPPITTYMEQVRTGLAAQLAILGANTSLMDFSKLMLAGASQGACDCFAYVRDYPTHVKAVGTWAGAVDLLGFAGGRSTYGDPGTGNQAAILADWKVASYAQIPANADPINNASAVSCPWLLGYSAGDATATPASQQAMAAGIPNNNGILLKFSDTDIHGFTEATSAAANGVAEWILRQAA